MRVILVPSSVGDCREAQDQFLTSYVINDSIAVDAGCLGYYKSPQDQARIKHVLISHSHIDHLASLPIFLENVFDARAKDAAE